MTARHQIRVGGRIGQGRSPIDATPAPSVGEVLQAARERKGVDLHRAERDTKIRAKHLAALENGDYDELPGAVYARGFLRNYATYLGLDADELLEDWRAEQEAIAPKVREPMALPPQPLVEPKGHLRFTRQVFVGALLVAIVVVFLGYLGVQLLRFSHPPTLTLDQSPVQTLAADATTFTFSGKVDLPAAIVSVSGPDGFGQTVNADSSGRWTLQVPVTKGQNDFTITARDPQLPPDKGSAPLSVILTVPIPATPTPVPAPTGTTNPDAPPPTIGAGGTPLPVAQLTVTAPLDGAQLTSGPVQVSGTSNAATVTITATYVGPAGVTPPSPSPQPSPAPGTTPAPPPSPPGGGPAPVQLNVTAGAYSGSISLTQGRWIVASTADAVDGSLAATSQSVTVDVTNGNGLVLEVHATDKAAWIRVIADGTIVEQGLTYRRNESHTYTAKTFITVTTGNAGSTDFVLNGKDFGTLGGDGQVQTWRFEKGKAPRRV